MHATNNVVKKKALYINTDLSDIPAESISNAQAVINPPHISKGKLYVNLQLLEKTLASDKDRKK